MRHEMGRVPSDDSEIDFWAGGGMLEGHEARIFRHLKGQVCGSYVLYLRVQPRIRGV